MKYKILVTLLGLGALGYLLRDKVVALANDILDKVDALIEDQTPDEESEVPDPVK